MPYLSLDLDYLLLMIINSWMRTASAAYASKIMTLTTAHSLLHTTLYGSAAGCRSIQKTGAFWKHGLTFENTQSQLTYFCKSNINQTFTNGSGMIWGVMIAIFTEIRHLVEELITFLSFFGPQKLSILTARLNKSLSISTSNSMRAWD